MAKKKGRESKVIRPKTEAYPYIAALYNMLDAYNCQPEGCHHDVSTAELHIQKIFNKVNLPPKEDIISKFLLSLKELQK